ncbi:hypothetical protein JNX00_20585 [Hydrogenophaga sp. YM1]|uniref:YciI family protein n=1 Tax=Hydrogenophaga sp. YM1 TaxID=2806262 RepID=UPI001957D23A|nr:YciI family protein [Hydrogenophaga sp. YM1]QRR33995.1 hypothetical protein JNX00_20585 [Hydrogenophaga sp. YM1]
MDFVIYALNRPGGEGKRLTVRDAHMACVSAHATHFIYAGPLLDEGGGAKGSVFVLRFDDRAALDAYMAADPFFGEGIFETVLVSASRQVMPAPLPVAA